MHNVQRALTTMRFHNLIPPRTRPMRPRPQPPQHFSTMGSSAPPAVPSTSSIAGFSTPISDYRSMPPQTPTVSTSEGISHMPSHTAAPHASNFGNSVGTAAVLSSTGQISPMASTTSMRSPMASTTSMSKMASPSSVGEQVAKLNQIGSKIQNLAEKLDHIEDSGK